MVEIYNEGEYEKIIADAEGRYLTLYVKNPPNYLKASKSGYSSRVIKSRPANDLLSYRDGILDFGGDGSKGSHRPEAALDPRPEVIQVRGKNDTLSGPTEFNLRPEFTLTFSKPVNKSDVESKLAYHGTSSLKPNVIDPPLYSDAESFPFLSESLLDAWFGNKAWNQSSVILGSEALRFEWNQTGDEVTVRLKPGYQLPGNATHYPDLLWFVHEYRVALNFTQFGSNDRSLRDLEGQHVRTDNHFYLTGHTDCLGQCPQQSSYTISSASGEVIGTHRAFAGHINLRDNQPPRLEAIEPLDASLRLRFSEIMAVRTRAGLIAGGMIDRREQGLPGSETRAPAEYPGNKGNVTGPKTASNYRLRVLSQGQEKLAASWQALGGSAHYDEADASWQSVRLRPPRNTSGQAQSFYPAHSLASTAAVPAGWGQGSTASDSWTLRWRGISRSGTPGPVQAVTVPGHALRSPVEWAAQVQLALNAELPETPWQVKASADGQHLQLHFSSAHWIGWQLVEMNRSSAAFATGMLTPAQSWAAETDWRWWQAGDTLEVEVIHPILDPAGNTIGSDGKKATLAAAP